MDRDFLPSNGEADYRRQLMGEAGDQFGPVFSQVQKPAFHLCPAESRSRETYHWDSANAAAVRDFVCRVDPRSAPA